MWRLRKANPVPSLAPSRTMSLPIILGSSSKWRRGVLAQLLGLSGPDEITAMAADIDEKGANLDPPRVPFGDPKYRDLGPMLGELLT